MPMIDDVIRDIFSRSIIKYSPDESAKDATAMVSAFAEVVVEPPVTHSEAERDVLLILSVLDYLTPEAERNYGLNPIYPKGDDVRRYIERQRKKLNNNASEDGDKKTEIKARVNDEEFKKAKQGQRISPFRIFYFFGI